MAKQVRVVQFDKRAVVDWVGDPHPLPPYSAARALELYLAWAMARGWRLLTVLAMGPEFYVVWEGEDTTGSPDPWETS